MDNEKDTPDEIENIHFWFYALHDLIPNLDSCSDEGMIVVIITTTLPYI